MINEKDLTQFLKDYKPVFTFEDEKDNDYSIRQSNYRNSIVDLSVSNGILKDFITKLNEIDINDISILKKIIEKKRSNLHQLDNLGLYNQDNCFFEIFICVSLYNKDFKNHFRERPLAFKFLEDIETIVNNSIL